MKTSTIASVVLCVAAAMSASNLYAQGTFRPFQKLRAQLVQPSCGEVKMNSVTPSFFGKTQEGDHKTPIGDFGITTAFGIKENPGTALPYIDVDENTYCCGDENFYNQMIDISEHPHDCADGEHIIDYSPEYNYGIFIDYNKDGTPGLGSAIFFHCAGANTYTGGCIAVSEENMLTILKALDINARIIIDYIP